MNPIRYANINVSPDLAVAIRRAVAAMDSTSHRIRIPEAAGVERATWRSRRRKRRANRSGR
jgi:hypothetical protein